MSAYTIPGLTEDDSRSIAAVLQERLSAYNDLHLTLKHVHWNVVGPQFVAVHEMLDPQVDEVRGYAAEVAERIAALGVAPVGTPGQLIKDRSWEDYSLNRDTVPAHLAALDLVYVNLIRDLRNAIASVGKLDPVTEDMLIGQAAGLEKFHWFIRAHLENAAGSLISEGSSSEGEAAEKARDL